MPSKIIIIAICVFGLMVLWLLPYLTNKPVVWGRSGVRPPLSQLSKLIFMLLILAVGIQVFYPLGLFGFMIVTILVIWLWFLWVKDMRNYNKAIRR